MRRIGSACIGIRCATGWTSCASRPDGTPTTPRSGWSSGSRSKRSRHWPRARRRRPRENCVVYRTPTQAFLCHHMSMPKTVVIVDDHPSFRASARMILQAEGFEVVGEAEYGGLIAQSGARGFIPKAELDGTALADLLG